MKYQITVDVDHVNDPDPASMLSDVMNKVTEAFVARTGVNNFRIEAVDSVEQEEKN